MNTITRIMGPLQRVFEAISKARVNSVLLGMGREKVEEYGYSYDALRLGPAAWPWRETPQNRAKEVGTCISQVNTCSDRQLRDPGIPRNDFDKADRNSQTVERDQDAA